MRLDEVDVGKPSSHRPSAFAHARRAPANSVGSRLLNAMWSLAWLRLRKPTARRRLAAVDHRR